MEKLTQKEEEVMLHIWRLGLCCIKDILTCYNGYVPPYTTIASIVNKLKYKGYLKSFHYNNMYLYIPKVSKEEYKNILLDKFIEDYFSNSYKNLVYFMVHNRLISITELREIIFD
jgi:BlaI family penicillinase repressor